MSIQINKTPKIYLSVSSFDKWKHEQTTQALMEIIKTIQKEEAISLLAHLNPSKKDTHQIALEAAFQAGRQSIFEKFKDFNLLKETFLSDQRVIWEE